MVTSLSLTASGHPLDLSAESFGELRRSGEIANDFLSLNERLKEDGYLYIPGFFNRADVLEASREFSERLNRKGALHPDHPVSEWVVPAEPVAFTRAELVEGNRALTGVVFSPKLLSFYEQLLGGEIRHYDHIWTRVIRPGNGTPPHCDLPYMGRGTRKVYTAWIPYRDTSLELGGLMLLEKSHLQAERLEKYLAIDSDVYCVNRGAYQHGGYLSNNPVSLREKMGGRWLTTEFRAGDLLTFGMTMVHASLDNHSSGYRVSTDTRYQLASEPIDDRWVGPATEEWAEKNRVGKIC